LNLKKKKKKTFGQEESLTKQQWGSSRELALAYLSVFPP